MNPRYLLDTDIFIHLRDRRTRAVIARFEQLRRGEVGVSVISYGELIYGAEKSASSAATRRLLQEILALIPVLPLPINAGEVYGALRASLERRGEMIGGNDLWIASHAKAADLVVVTNNEREFKRIPELRIENWAR